MDFPRNYKMEMVATCTKTDGNGCCHELVPSFFDDMTCCRCKQIASDDQATQIVDRNSAIYVCLR